jgi:hypothetical protein
MKRITRTIVLLALLHAAGCTREDESDCPNVLLSFVLPAVAGVEGTLLDNVHSVDVLVLDSAGRYLGVERVEGEALEKYRGARLQLPPGRYRLACLANAGENTVMEGLESLPGGGAITFRPGTAAGDCDPLFRAPGAVATRAALAGSEREVDGLLTVEVPREGKVEPVAAFVTAHRQLEVRVTGYGRGGAMPDVEISGLPAGNSLFTGQGLLDDDGEPLVLAARKRAVAATGETAVASFTTFLFALDDPGVVIRVIDPATGAVIAGVPLVEVIDPTTPVATVEINVDITFLDGDVTIVVNGWQERPVMPGRAGER